MGRSFWLLVLAQGLNTTNSVVLIAINALVGLSLAPSAKLSTLPAALTVVGSAISTLLVARLQRVYGRKRAFQLGLLVGVAAFALCALAVLQQSFGLLIVGSFISGFYGASGSLYRFAATELVPADQRERALSLVLVGGLLGAIAGPNLATQSRDLLSQPYLGAYVAMAVVVGLAFVALAFIDFPSLGSAGGPAQGRSMGQLLRQPAIAVSVLGAALGFGVMNLIMTATPVAMKACGTSFASSSNVLELHVVAMFVPGFFSGRLNRRFGPLRIMAAGLLLMLCCVGIVLSGVELTNFYAGLFALGLGWNFLYTGSSTLLISAYEPAEKTRAQGMMDLFVFSTLAVSSLSSGALVTGPGWNAVNQVALAPLFLLAAGIAYLWKPEHLLRR